MSIQTLTRQFVDLPPFRQLLRKIQAGESVPALGLRRSARLPVLSALHNELQRPILLLTDRADTAMTILDELALWSPEVESILFREPNPLFYEDASWGEGTRRDRLMALTTLGAHHIPGAPKSKIPPIIIAPARAIMTRTLPRREFIKATRTLRPTQIFQPETLLRNWVCLGYEPVNTVIAPGQFARRGGILDLWPPADSQPTRIEFFGDEIETLRSFDPTSQRTLQTSEYLFVTPAREFLTDPQPLTHTNQEDDTGTTLTEFHIPLLSSPASILDYLPRQALLFIDDLQTLQDTIAEVEEQAINLRRDYIADGTLPENYPCPYLTWTEIADSLHGCQVIELGSSASLVDEEGRIEISLSQVFSPGPRFGGHLKILLEHLSDRQALGESIFIVSRQSARLRELWTERSPSSPKSNLQTPHFLEGSLTEGWTLTPPNEVSLHLLTDGEIFGWRRPEPRQRVRAVAESPEAAYSDLQVDDWVVHVDHGIGRFGGLVQRTIDNIEREYLSIEYANDTHLFVPVHQADRITRYLGPDNRSPTPDHLGGRGWRKARARVKEAVKKIAEELLELYAKRNVIHGHAFLPDTPWQQELEASFPYIETEDQVRVLNEVKRDMENSRPMDRLVCGDVGYGKTEVALRAAFKAVMDGKQVAVLVPTTVLAQQHFYTFQQRLAAFPVEVEMLSRFRTPQQQRDILNRLITGGVDIVIGTHRLFSADVQFKDLGLLVIDEEQRFGVTHKETLKKMRTEVDVLTLTATPIPRTLYMTLTGVRDISTINTPPEERLPIVTHIGPYSPRIVRQAVLRELERGGQVFFVHNRVQTIRGMYNHLKRLVPEAYITIAHGQMRENELSERMKQFTSGEVDVLLSTSIIESGLDIPNANTLIVDRADTFGLTQLYQLRGRVGRGAQRAYAYFFRHKRRTPTHEGRQRLETIAENTQLGAGFSIAMRDLEIRGTGDILGTRQHGHIAAVGFHLYTRLLAGAVRRLREKRDLPPTTIMPSLATGIPLPVNVDLPLPISIPASYVPDKGMRLHLYRRLADMHSLSEVDAMAEEFDDRFGTPPEPVRNLLYQLRIKLLAEAAGLASVSGENGQIVLRFPEDQFPTRAFDLGPEVRIGKYSLWLAYVARPNWRERLTETLRKLGAT